MSYVNIALAAVPSDNKDNYLRSAEKMAAFFISQGAIRVLETWENDAPDGQQTSLPMAVKKQEHEQVVASVIFWPSKECSDAAMKNMMDNEEVKQHMPFGLFDFGRLIHGGFDVILDQSE